MTKDDIIKMARVAGVRDDGHRFEFSEYKYLERFANLVAAAQKEADAKLCEEIEPFYGVMFANAIRARGTP
jgi:hypothetical protein